jgi:alpha-glucosidase
MRWDDSRNGGFTTGKPWLQMGNDVAERNIARQQQDPRSLTWLYRSLIALRRNEPALTAGAYRPLRGLDDVLMFKRCHGDELQIALNFSHDPRRVQSEREATLLLSTHLDRAGTTITSPFILRGMKELCSKLSAGPLDPASCGVVHGGRAR